MTDNTTSRAASRAAGAADDAVERATAALDIRVGQVYERVPMLCRDGTRFRITARDHTRIRITQVPEGRKRTYRYVKVDPRPMGNGRRDRGERGIAPTTLARHYELEATDA